jgi:hypothetical protein
LSLVTSEAEIQRIVVQDPQRQKVSDSPVSWVWWPAHVISAIRKKDRRSRPALAKTQNLIQKITKAKWAKAEAHVIEHLPSKPKAPSSNPSTAQRTKQTRKTLTFSNEG